MTPKLRLDADDLTTPLLRSKSFHLICNPTRAISMARNIMDRRKKERIPGRPLILWEPVPGVCSPNDWEDCVKAMGVVDVISPNVNEAASFLGLEIDEEQDFKTFKVEVESMAEEYVVKTTCIVVFRCGKHGCLVATKEMKKWLPAYHQSPERVVDPTGGGNAFCGGYCAGWI